MMMMMGGFNSCETYLCFHCNGFLSLSECFVRLGIGFPTKCKMNQKILFVKHKSENKVRKCRTKSKDIVRGTQIPKFGQIGPKYFRLRPAHEDKTSNISKEWTLTNVCSSVTLQISSGVMPNFSFIGTFLLLLFILRTKKNIPWSWQHLISKEGFSSNFYNSKLQNCHSLGAF